MIRSDEEREAVVSALGDALADVFLSIVTGARKASIRARGTVGGQAFDVSITLELSDPADGVIAQDDHGPAAP